MAGIPGLDAILGNPVLEQIITWQVLGQLIGPALAPFVQALSNMANGANQEVPLSPADLALAVVRNVYPEATAAQLAAMSGLSPANFHTLTLLTGDAPAPEALAEALRRGFIDAARYDQGIRQGRLRDEWGGLLQQLATRDPSPVDALDALLKGQTDQATALQLYTKWGGNPEYFQLMFHTQGASPSPQELGVLANRGIIPWTGTGPDVVSFDQGFLEGHWRNKWSGPLRKLAEYIPPPRTVTALVHEGVVTDAQALELYKEAGLSDQLAAAYLRSASSSKTAATKELAASIVHSLYVDKLIAADVATGFLENLAYTKEEAAYILNVWDLEDVERFLRSAVTRIHALYVAHKITQSVASEALAKLDVPAGNVTRILQIWSEERAANVRVLTPAQIAAALKAGLIGWQNAHDRLVAEGYPDSDATLFLEIELKETQAAYTAGLAAAAAAAPAGG